LKVFGVGVLEERGRRNRWERMKPEVQDRCDCLLCLLCKCRYVTFALYLFRPCRVMEKASAYMHTKCKKARKGEAQVTQTLTMECTYKKTKSKLFHDI
jgi:hypothetical protein